MSAPVPPGAIAEFLFSGDRIVMSCGDTTIPVVDFGFNLTEKSSGELKKSFLEILGSYDQLAPYSIPLLSKLDAIVLLCALDSCILRTLGSRLLVLETGGGPSLESYMTAQVLRFFSRDNQLLCVWPSGDDGADFAADREARARHREIVRALGIGEQMAVACGDPERVKSALGAGAFDMIILGRCRPYGEMLRELAGAAELLRPGGILMGWGSECAFSQQPEAVRKKPPDQDLFLSGALHAGVIAALEALFGKNFVRPVPQSSLWMKTMTEEERGRVLKDRLPPDEYARILFRHTADVIRKKLARLETAESFEDGLLCEAAGKFLIAERQMQSEAFDRHLKFGFLQASDCFFDFLAMPAERKKSLRETCLLLDGLLEQMEPK